MNNEAENMDMEREAFEAWMRTNYPGVRLVRAAGNGYTDHRATIAWQARAAASAKAAPVRHERLRALSKALGNPQQLAVLDGDSEADALVEMATAFLSQRAAPVVPSHLFGALCHARDIVKSRTIWKAGTPSADHAEAVLADLDAIITANRPSPDAVQAAPAPTDNPKEKACTNDCESAAKSAAGSAATTTAVRSTPTTPDAASPALPQAGDAVRVCPVKDVACAEAFQKCTDCPMRRAHPTEAAPAIPEGETLADRLDWLADRQPPGSQAQSDLYAAATIWRKHLKPSLLTQAAPAAVQGEALEVLDAFEAKYNGFHLSHDDFAEWFQKLREALAASAPTADPVREAAQHISAAIEKQLELIRERAPGDYLDKRPVVQALASHKRRLDAALSTTKESKV